MPSFARGRVRDVVLALILLVASLWPHVYVLFLRPVSRDEVQWITRGAISSPGWARWDFVSSHFVGYRPLTALSYTVDSGIGGFAAWPYRATDLGLHVVAVGLVYALFRRLSESRAGAWAAAAVFAAHPVTALVVPHLARRGYSLATCGSLLGLVILLGPPRSWRSLAGGLALAAGALANEAAYVAFPVAAVALYLRDGRRAAVEAMAPGAAMAVILVILRTVILRGMGGYDVERGPRILAIAESTWTGALSLDALRSDATAVPAGLAVALILVAGLAAATLAGPATDARFAAGVGWTWLVGLTLVYAPQGVFFPRQVYLAVPALALIVGGLVGQATVAAGIRKAGLGLAVAAVAVLELRQSPVLWGPDPIQYGCWTANDRMLEDAEAQLDALPAAAVIHAVVPYYRRPELESLRARDDDEEGRMTGKQALSWLSQTRDLKFGQSVEIFADAGASDPNARLVDDPAGPYVVLAPGAEVAHRSDKVEVAGDVIRLDFSVKSGRRPWLYFHDGLTGRVVALPEPP